MSARGILGTYPVIQRMVNAIRDHYLPARVVLAIRSWAREQPDVARVYVFGSRVRGINKDGGPVLPTSDLDIAIELVSYIASPIQFWMETKGSWTRALEASVPFPVHLELLDRLSEE